MTAVRILIVEDELIVGEHLKRNLMSLGYIVEGVAVSAEKAFQAIDEHRPDLVLMDIGLRGKQSGISAAQQVQNGYHIPVVFMTGNTDPETFRQANLIEPFGFVTKPYQLQHLQATLENALHKHNLEQRLRRSEEHHRLLAHLMTEYAFVVGVDKDGSLHPEWENEALVDLLGMTSYELAVHGGWPALVHPDDRQIFEEQRKKHLAGHPDISQYRILTQYGSLHWLRHYGHPVWGELEGRVVRIYNAVLDITSQVETNKKLQDSQRILQAVFDSLNLGITIIDLDANIQQVNKDVVRIFGYDKKTELIGLNVFDFLVEEERAEAGETMKKVLHDGQIQGLECTCLKKDGSRFTIHINANLIRDSQGNPVGFATVIHELI